MWIWAKGALLEYFTVQSGQFQSFVLTDVDRYFVLQSTSVRLVD
jgi:hypothetical protein